MTEEQRRVAAHYQKFGPVIYRRCLKLLRDPEQARDATQDVFMKLTREMARFDDTRSVLPWIYRTATHHCLNIIRDASRRSKKEGDLPVWATQEDLPGSGTDDSVSARRLVARMLTRFDAETQAVAFGVLIDGMQHDELAEALGISRKTVSRKLDRFLINARKYIARSDV